MNEQEFINYLSDLIEGLRYNKRISHIEAANTILQEIKIHYLKDKLESEIQNFRNELIKQGLPEYKEERKLNE